MNIEASEPVAFNPEFSYSDSYPNIFDDVNLVSTQCLTVAWKLTYLIA